MDLKSTFDRVDYPMKRLTSFAQRIASKGYAIQIHDIEDDIYVSKGSKAILQRGRIPSLERRFSFSLRAAVLRLPKGMIA